MFGLQRLEFAHQAVVLDVRDVRLVEDVVAMVGVVDQAAQFGDAGGGFGGHCGILGHRVWWMRALAWYSRLDWQAAPRRSGFSRALFGRAWTGWQKLQAEAAPDRAVATRLQGGDRLSAGEGKRVERTVE